MELLDLPDDVLLQVIARASLSHDVVCKRFKTLQDSLRTSTVVFHRDEEIIQSLIIRRLTSVSHLTLTDLYPSSWNTIISSCVSLTCLTVTKRLFEVSPLTSEELISCKTLQEFHCEFLAAPPCWWARCCPSLTVFSCKGGSEDLFVHLLDYCPSLSSLEVHHINNEPFPSLVSLLLERSSQLRSLSLNGVSVLDRPLRAAMIQCVPFVERLAFVYSQHQMLNGAGCTEDLRPLADRTSWLLSPVSEFLNLARNLKSLEFSCIFDYDRAALLNRGLSKLENLTITGDICASDQDPLPHLTAFGFLSLSGFPCVYNSLRTVRVAEQSMNMSTVLSCFLGAIPNVVDLSLSISYTGLGEECAGMLAQFEFLEILRLSSGTIVLKDAGRRPVVLPQLLKLYLHYVQCPEHICLMFSLPRLVKFKCEGREASVYNFTNMPQLTSLDLNLGAANQVEFLRGVLPQLPHIRALTLHSDRIADLQCILSVLSGHAPLLQKLSLSPMIVRSSSLRHLLRSYRLKQLRFHSSIFTPECVQVYEQHGTALRELSLSSNVPPHMVLELCRSLAQCCLQTVRYTEMDGDARYKLYEQIEKRVKRYSQEDKQSSFGSLESFEDCVSLTFSHARGRLMLTRVRDDEVYSNESYIF